MGFGQERVASWHPFFGGVGRASAALEDSAAARTGGKAGRGGRGLARGTGIDSSVACRDPSTRTARLRTARLQTGAPASRLAGRCAVQSTPSLQSCRPSQTARSDAEPSDYPDQSASPTSRRGRARRGSQLRTPTNVSRGRGRGPRGTRPLITTACDRLRRPEGSATCPPEGIARHQPAPPDVNHVGPRWVDAHKPVHYRDSVPPYVPQNRSRYGVVPPICIGEKRGRVGWPLTPPPGGAI